jgi:agmatinase
MKRVLRGLTGLDFVGADIVEVAPAYDTGAFVQVHLKRETEIEIVQRI